MAGAVSVSVARPRRQAAYLALALLCSVQMMLFLDDTVVNVALPAIGRDLGMSEAGLTWIVTTGLRGGLGVLLLAGFVIAEPRQRNPLIPLSFFRDRDRAVANLGNVLFCSANLSMLFFLTLYMQDVMHYSPARTGLAWLPFCAAVIAGFGTAAGTASRVGVRPLLVAALGVGSAGMLLLSTLSVHGGYLNLLPGLLVAGLGMGLGFVSITIAAVGETHEDITGLASGLVTSTQQLGGALGLGVISALAIGRSTRLAGHASQAAALTNGFHLAFILCCCVLAVATVLVGLGVTARAGISPDGTRDSVAAPDQPGPATESS